MSGLEPLAVLGLACNILQLVELGHKTIETIKIVYQGRTPNDELEKNAEDLEKLITQVKEDSRPGKNKFGEILLQSADTCSKAARDLRKECEFISSKVKRGDLGAVWRVMVAVTRRKSRLERLKLNLDTEERRMQTSLLAQVWSSTNATQFDSNDTMKKIRLLIEQYEKGFRATTEPVLKKTEEVLRKVEEIYKAALIVHQSMESGVALGKAQVDEQACLCFLQSLEYPGFNQRRNQIDPALCDTLQWIFVGDNDNDSNDPEAEELVSKIKWDSFSNWLSSTDPVYWISGKPGSGKTTLLKYITKHSQTRKYLNSWSLDCVIISHYFWGPGSQMQKNIEGLFCSLLYQLLDENPTTLRHIMSSVSGRKNCHTDWSSAELRLALQSALNFCGKGVCLFLDGLDEIDPEDKTKDGIPELLDWVSKLSESTKIKLCLASRAEPIFEMRLSVYQGLRLQDLNYPDLMAYAKKHVTSHATETSTDFEDRVQELVSKSEGIFLWLILAIKNVNEGITNDDSKETLRERINSLPKDLVILYEDMWRRAGAESPNEYRRTAAHYFRLVLASDSRPNLFDLMLITTPIADRVLDALTDPSKAVDSSEILRKCQEVERKLKIYCVGLVEVGPEAEFDNDTASDDRKVLRIGTGCSLSFIHRSACDFLTDTVLGRDILNLDKSSNFAIHCQVMKAWLIRFALHLNYGDPECRSWHDKLKRFLNRWRSTNEWVLDDWSQLILTCEKVANRHSLLMPCMFGPEVSDVQADNNIELCAGTDFLRVLVCHDLHDDFVISRLTNGNLTANDKTIILMALNDATRAQRYLQCGERISPRDRIFRELLREGADLNCHIWTTSIYLPIAHLRTPWKEYLFGLCRYFYTSYHWHDLFTCRYRHDTPDLTIMAEVIHIFISYGARLDDMVDMVVFWDEKTELWVIEECWKSTRESGHSKNGVFASVPAYTILKMLANVLRQLSSHSDASSLLENQIDHGSSKTCRVFGKVEEQSEECVLWETPNEMQMQLGTRLVRSLETQILLMISVTEGKDHSQEGRSEIKELSESILNDASWITKLHGNPAIWKWLEQQELAKPMDSRDGRLLEIVVQRN